MPPITGAFSGFFQFAGSESPNRKSHSSQSTFMQAGLQSTARAICNNNNSMSGYRHTANNFMEEQHSGSRIPPHGLAKIAQETAHRENIERGRACKQSGALGIPSSSAFDNRSSARTQGTSFEAIMRHETFVKLTFVADQVPRPAQQIQVLPDTGFFRLSQIKTRKYNDRAFPKPIPALQNLQRTYSGYVPGQFLGSNMGGVGVQVSSQPGAQMEDQSGLGAQPRNPAEGSGLAYNSVFRGLPVVSSFGMSFESYDTA